MKKVLIYAMAALLLAGCGSVDMPEERLDLTEEVETTPQSTLNKLLAQGVTVNLSSTISGNWNVTDFAISEVNPLTMNQNADMQFNGNGDVSPWSCPPLFDFVDVVAVEPPLVHAGDMRCTAMPWGDTYLTDQLNGSGEFFNAMVHYEIVDTGYEPILQFIVSGTQYTSCYTTGSDCSTMPECYESEIRERVLGYVIRGTDNNAFVIETPKHYVLFERANNP